MDRKVQETGPELAELESDSEIAENLEETVILSEIVIVHYKDELGKWLS